MANVKAAVIITAGGVGKRFDGQGGNKLLKQFIPLSGKPIISYSIQSFESSELVSEIIVVVPENQVEYTQTEIVDKYNFQKLLRVVSGGDERQNSVEKGIQSITSDPDVIVVHDGVRPFASPGLIEEVIKEASKTGGAIAAIPATDTIKKSAPKQFIESTLPREQIWFAQTPQAFKSDIIKEAFKKAKEDRYLGTDEAELVERLGKEVKLVLGSKYNIKITTPEDIEIGERIINSGVLENKED